MAVRVRNAFNRKFFNKTTGSYGNNTVTANLLPLYFGIVAESDRAVVFRHIVDKIEKEDNGHISTGVIGTQWLMRGLTEYGRPDLAFRIADNRDYPSWGYMVERGATTIWELWNGDSANPAMNSQNHIMLLGDLLTWFYEDLAGIAPASPGFKTIRMRPSFPVGLDHVQASYHTPYGMVSSEWKRDGDKLYWDVSVPPNTKALVHLPSGHEESIGSGQYHYTITKNE